MEIEASGVDKGGDVKCILARGQNIGVTQNLKNLFLFLLSACFQQES